MPIKPRINALSQIILEAGSTKKSRMCVSKDNGFATSGAPAGAIWPVLLTGGFSAGFSVACSNGRSEERRVGKEC